MVKIDETGNVPDFYFRGENIGYLNDIYDILTEELGMSLIFISEIWSTYAFIKAELNIQRY